MNNNNLFTYSPLFLAVILVTGGIFGLLSSPLTAFGETYQNVKCDDANVNVNIAGQFQAQQQSETNDFVTGADTTELNEQDLTPQETMDELNGNGEEPLLNLDRNIVNVCINENDNELDAEFFPIQEQGQDNNPLSCEECFTENLTPGQLDGVNRLLGELAPQTLNDFFVTQISVNDLAAFCTLLSLVSTEEGLRDTVFNLIATVNAFYLPTGGNIIEESVGEEIVQCILEALASEV